MRAWLLSMLVLATPALAGTPATLEVAPAGICAGDEGDLDPRVLPVPPAGEPAALEVGIVHLTPADVASNAALAALPLPAPAVFEGPGACDNPGSGCAGREILEDPDPGTGCGFPGSPCP
jgi:hypothetical protein